MATPKKLTGKIYIDTAPTPPTQKPPSNYNGGATNAPKLHRQHNNKENNTNSDEGEGWLTVNSKGMKVKGVKPDPPRQTMSMSGNNAYSYSNAVAAQRVRHQQIQLFVRLQNDFREWSQISDAVLLQTLDQHQYDEESTRRALFEMSGAIANNNHDKDSSAPSSNKVNHLPAPPLPADFPELQKMSAPKSQKMRAPMQYQTPGPSLPSSTPRVTSGLRPVPQKAAWKSHSSRPSVPTLGDYLFPKMGEANQSRTRSFDTAALSAGPFRPRSGNKAPKKSQKRGGGKPEQSRADIIVLDDSDDDASGNEFWASTEEKKAVEDAIADTNKAKDTVLARACQKYPNISSDALHQTLETAQYDADIVQSVCDKQGSASTKLDYDAAMQKYEELKTGVYNLRCYRDNLRRDYCKHMLHVLHPNNLPEELWSVFTQAQGKCPLPNWRKHATNLDGRTSILHGGRMEACSSVQTAIAWSQGLPTSSFNYGNGDNFDPTSVNDVHKCLNFLVNNYVDHCSLSTRSGLPPEEGPWSCHNPTPNQMTDVVDILHLQFKYLLLLDYPVLYINMGGTVVEPIMRQVLKRLKNDQSITPAMMKMLCVIESNRHMYKASFCFEDYAVGTELEDYVTEVTNFALQISNKITKFYNDLNRVRVSLSLDPIECSNIFEQLVRNKRVAYIARRENEASWKHMLDTYSAQKGLGADERLSEWGPNGLTRNSASSQGGDTNDFVMEDNAASWTNVLDIHTEQQSTSRKAAVATNAKEHSIVDVEPFIQFIDTFDNAETETLTAAIDLPILRLPQVLVDLAFKKREGLCLYNTLKHVTFDTLSILGPLSKLNRVVGAFLVDESAKMKKAATKMKQVIDLRRAGVGSIISYLDNKMSRGEDEGESPSVPDEVMAVKEAIYRAIHGNYGTEVDEEVRSTINNAVSNSQLQTHVNIGYDTSNLITNMLDILFILFLLSELSILDIYEYLSKQDSLIKSLEEFARRVNPEGYFDVAMMGIDFLFIFAAPALRNGKHRNDAFKITNSLLCSLNKIVSVSNNASAEKKMNDPRKRKFLSTFREFECQASDGTEDTNAAKYWSGTDDTNSARRSRAGRNFGNHFCRVVIEECVPPDTFSKLGYTQSLLCLSPSLIGSKCSYIKPEVYSNCKDDIPTQIGELKKSFDKKENTGKRTIFIENEEQCNSLKQLVKTYEALQSD